MSLIILLSIVNFSSCYSLTVSNSSSLSLSSFITCVIPLLWPTSIASILAIIVLIITVRSITSSALSGPLGLPQPLPLCATTITLLYNLFLQAPTSITFIDLYNIQPQSSLILHTQAQTVLITLDVALSCTQRVTKWKYNYQ